LSGYGRGFSRNRRLESLVEASAFRRWSIHFSREGTPEQVEKAKQQVGVRRQAHGSGNPGQSGISNKATNIEEKITTALADIREEDRQAVREKNVMTNRLKGGMNNAIGNKCTGDRFPKKRRPPQPRRIFSAPERQQFNGRMDSRETSRHGKPIS
jgi:hypothetical protein